MNLQEFATAFLRVDVALLAALVFAIFKGGRWTEKMVGQFAELRAAFEAHTTLEIARFDAIGIEIRTLKEEHRAHEKRLEELARRNGSELRPAEGRP